MASLLYKTPQFKKYSDDLKFLSNGSGYEEIVYDYFYNNYKNLLSYQGTDRIKPTIFIGAGFSLASGICDWNSTLKKMVEYCFKKYISIKLNDLEKFVGSSAIDHMNNMLKESENSYEMKLDLGEYLQNFYEENDYYNILNNLFLFNQGNKYYCPNDLHDILCQLFKCSRGIITTNYDLLIETALIENATKYGYEFNKNEQVFNYYETERFEKFVKSAPNKQFVIKIHGSIGKESFNKIVLSRYDYSVLQIDYSKIFQILKHAVLDKTKNNHWAIISYGTQYQDKDLLNLLSYLKGERGYKGTKCIVISSMELNDFYKSESDFINEVNTQAYGAFALPYPVVKENDHKYLKTTLNALLNCLKESRKASLF